MFVIKIWLFMDVKRKLVYAFGGLIFFMTCLFPPMDFQGRVDLKYLPSTFSYKTPFWHSIVWPQLVIQWVVLAFVIVALLLAFRFYDNWERRGDGNGAEENVGK